MDAYHILLGKSWIFDQKVMPNGYLTTYSMSKDKKKITLAPWASHNDLWAFKEWILNIKDEFGSSIVNHSLAVSLLNKYNHVFLEEIPFDLSSKRDIQHHIDLIPWVILPNKPSLLYVSKGHIENSEAGRRVNLKRVSSGVTEPMRRSSSTGAKEIWKYADVRG